MRLTQVHVLVVSSALCLLLSACGFQLRGTTQLPIEFKQVGLQGEGVTTSFNRILQNAFISARSALSSDKALATQLKIDNLKEGSTVKSYDASLQARQYLISIQFDYQIVMDGKVLSEQRVSLDKTLNYDADYVLGKREEEKQIRKALYEDAARLILQRLKSIKP